MRTLVAVAVLILAPSMAQAQATKRYPDRVEIRRTSYGVPHILAQDLAALGFGMAWVQMEDYGLAVPVNFLRARGELARHFGPDSLESDFLFAWTYRQMQRTYHLLHPDTQELLGGFADGVNSYVARHPEEFPGLDLPRFTARDAAALWVDETVAPQAGRFQRAQQRRRAREDSLRLLGAGSNAWALAPERTVNGNAILLRNPHLNWRAGYYEAHITVPGVINFYGDFRIGYPLYFNGGFNDNLGWATTNNNPDLEEVYALAVDPDRPDHVIIDGASLPLTRVPLTVSWKNGPGLSSETRVEWESPLGPVADRGDGKVYVVKSPGWGEYRKAEQFLRMMQAQDLAEWRAAMSLQAHTESNHTYADRQGNIFYVWNAAVPRFPHQSGNDTLAVPVASSSEVWRSITPFDSLPQLLNPPGGYLQNANDPFHFTNLEAVIDSAAYPPPYPRPELRLRSQLSLDLIGGSEVLSLEDVVRLKHSTRMLAAERFKDDLLAAVAAAEPTEDLTEGATILEQWDGSVDPEARGAVLFETWFRRFVSADSGDDRNFDERWRASWTRPWSAAAPTTTPDGIADPDRAVRILEWAVGDTRERFGTPAVPWGEVYRVRLGDLDLPANGCSGFLGCFRVLWFEEDEDGKRSAAGGDGWVLAVEFTDQGPRAYSVLAYGESNRPDSPHHTDQAEMFMSGSLKRVAFSEQDIADDLVRRYRPGQ